MAPICRKFTFVAPVIVNVVDAVGPIQGTVPAGGVTDDTHPTISGTGIPGNTVYVYQNGVGCGDTKVGADGKWSIKIPGALSNGVHDMTATQFAPGQPESVASNHWSITVDTSTPAKPVITGLTDDAGAAIPAGSSTTNAHPTVSGTALAGDIVTLYDGSTVIGSAKAGTDGKWSIKPSTDLSVGSHDVYAIDTNLAGTPSAQSTHVAFTVTSAFVAPVILNVVDAVGPVQGTVPAGGVTDDPRPTISGTGIPGDTVYLYQNGMGCGDTKVGADGKWSIKLLSDLSSGAHDFTATQFAPGQPQSVASNHWSITVDTSTPAKPAIPVLSDDNGVVIPAGSTTSNGHPHISGTGKAGDIITVYDGTSTLGSVKIGSDGKWIFTPAADLSTGSHSISVTDTNAAGAIGPKSDAFAFNFSLVADAPVILNVVDAVGPIQGTVPPGGVTDDPRPTISGTGIPGDTVYVYQNGMGCGDTKVGADGKWSIKLLNDLRAGVNDLTATQFAPGQPQSAVSNHWSITVDTSTPAKPVITGLTDDAGAAIPAGSSTTNAHPTVSGTALAGDIVTLYDGSTVIGSAKAGTDGKWSIKPSTDLSVGSHDVYAIDTNLAGTPSAQSAHVAFTVTSAFAPPAILNVVDATTAHTGTVPAGGATTDTHPTVSGTGIPGNTVYLYQNGMGCGDTKVAANGTWSIKITGDLSTGAHDFTATQFAAGQSESAVSNHWSITVSTPVVAPTESVTISGLYDDTSGSLVLVNRGGSTLDTTPIVKGTVDHALLSGESLVVYRDGNKVGTATMSGTSWSFNDSGVGVGSHTYTARVENSAGASAFSAGYSFSEASPFAPPVIANVVDATSAHTGTVPAGSTTTDTHPTISGTGIPGNTVYLYQNGMGCGDTKVAANGTWSIKLIGDLSTGAHDFTATQFAAGQPESAVSNHWSITVSTPVVAPTEVVTITGLYDDTSGDMMLVNKGGSTKDTTPSIRGIIDHALLNGESVVVYRDGTKIGTAEINGSTNWSFNDSGVAVGSHTYTVRVESSAGNGAFSAGYSFVEVSALTAPVIANVVDATSAHTGTVPAGGATTDTHPTVSGTGFPGYTVYLYQNGVGCGDTKVGADGKWSIKITGDLSSGAHDFTATQLAVIGGESAASNHWSITVSAPVVAPTESVTISGLYDDTSGSLVLVNRGGSTLDTTPIVKGTVDHALLSGESLAVYRDGNKVGTATMSGTSWSFNDSGVGVGSHTYTARVENSAGASAFSAGYSFSEASPFAPPVIANVVDATSAHTGTVPAGGATADTHPTVSGTGIPGDTVYLYQNGIGCGDTKVAANGTWSIKVTGGLSTGAHDFTATQFAAGQSESAISNHWSITVSAPVVAPTESVTISGLYDDTSGSLVLVNRGGSTLDTTPIVKGTVDHALLSGESLAVYRDGNKVGTATMSGTSWSFNDSGVGVGSHTYTARVENSAGASAFSAGYSFSEASPFAPPVIANVVDATSAHTGTVPAGGATADAHPTVSGTGIPGDTVYLYQNGIGCGDTKVAANGTWSIKVTGGLSTGAHDFTATQFATGQPESAASNHWSITVNTTPAVDPNIAHIVANGRFLAGLVNIIGYGVSIQLPTVDTAKVASVTVVDNLGKTLTSTSLVVLSDGNTYYNIPYYYPLYGSAGVNRINVYVTDTSGKKYLVDSGAIVFGSDGPGGVTMPYNVVVYSHGFSGGSAVPLASVSAVHSSQEVTSDSSDAQAVAASSTDDSSTLATADHHIAVGQTELFVGKSGHDTVDLNVDPASYFKESTAHIEGSKAHGIDPTTGTATAVNTLHLTGDHQVLDLTSLTGQTAAAKISGIEAIDLGGQHNTLKLSLTDVLNLGETDLFMKDGKQQMMVQGKEGDEVDLSNSHIAGLAEGEWQAHGTAQVGGVTYNVYEHSGAHTELLVQQGVQIVVH
ncbi:Ig-like domain-containing protein [Caballeronia sp. SBC1]|uniref:Ig-like domain-containing protein n=1 Tax=Caballeronia sp. SBC1 TaxID=2705548 RepID=UPI001407AC2C|nr:Ig-like domain-containing protein [Caballeronia sp. SBC1]